MTAAISIAGVIKRFGPTLAVDRLDLTVPRGALCGFLGRNGAGKSTTIRMIMSIIYPDEGSIEVLGGSALAAKDRIGYLPEERGVYRKMRVGEFLAYMGRLKGLPASGLRSRVSRWLARIELAGTERRRCSDLSKGMQQKVQFVAALLHEPELVILDEPFSGLDPINAEVMQSIIAELAREGRTIIFSTHAMHQAERLCDQIVLIDHGRKLLDSSMHSIRRTFNPRTVVVEPMDGEEHSGERSVNLSELESLHGVLECARRGDGGVELLLSEECDARELLLEIAGRVPFRRLELRQVTLEEVFIRLVRSTPAPERATSAATV